MAGKVVLDFDLDKEVRQMNISNNNYFGGIKDLYTLVKFCDNNNDLFVAEINGVFECCYMRDIRFNYVDNEIFFPIYTYDYKELDDSDKAKLNKSKKAMRFRYDKIGYNQRVEKFIIQKQGKWCVDNLLIIHRFFGENTLYSFELTDVIIRDDIIYENAQQLFYKYIRSSYADKTLSMYNYSSSKYSSLTKQERDILEKYDLTWYTDFVSIDYCDVRTYSYSELADKFNEEILQPDISLALRRIDFESYLMSHLQNKVYWGNWTRGDFNKLLRGKSFFVKYKEVGVALIFKIEWLSNY